MNVNTIMLFDKVMDQSMDRFSKLIFVKKEVYTHNVEYLASKVSYITELYTDCFANFGWLSRDMQFYKRILQGNIHSSSELNQNDSSVSKIIEYLPEQETMKENFPMAFHVHFTVLPNLCYVSGIIWKDDLRRVFISLSECSIPSDIIIIPQGPFEYLPELLEEFDSIKSHQLRDWINEKELSIHKIQKHAKKYWGDSFYSYYLKMKMIEAIDDILFTSKTLKEIAVSHNFVKYNNMYRTFKRYHIDLAKISRFSKI